MGLVSFLLHCNARNLVLEMLKHTKSGGTISISVPHSKFWICAHDRETERIRTFLAATIAADNNNRIVAVQAAVTGIESESNLRFPRGSMIICG